MQLKNGELLLKKHLQAKYYETTQKNHYMTQNLYFCNQNDAFTTNFHLKML